MKCRIIDFGFRIRIINWTSGVKYRTVWDKNRRGRGIFVISPNPFPSFSFFPVAIPPDPASLSLISALFFPHLISTINAPQELEFEQIFATHSRKSHPFGLPHEPAFTWCEIWAKSREPTTFLVDPSTNSGAQTLVKVQPCILVVNCL